MSIFKIYRRTLEAPLEAGSAPSETSDGRSLSSSCGSSAIMPLLWLCRRMKDNSSTALVAPRTCKPRQ